MKQFSTSATRHRVNSVSIYSKAVTKWRAGGFVVVFLTWEVGRISTIRLISTPDGFDCAWEFRNKHWKARRMRSDFCIWFREWLTSIKIFLNCTHFSPADSMPFAFHGCVEVSLMRFNTLDNALEFPEHFPILYRCSTEQTNSRVSCLSCPCVFIIHDRLWATDLCVLRRARIYQVPVPSRSGAEQCSTQLTLPWKKSSRMLVFSSASKWKSLGTLSRKMRKAKEIDCRLFRARSKMMKK